MGNMSYCKFRNTLDDLRDCYADWETADTEDEEKARTRMLDLCKKIVDEYGEEDEDE